ncbi:S-layer homology domain-containing protein [Leucobacter chromiireducens]|uniref:SLH domain-containing protein n=1 Tax=Leucobacter chromiireducens subsp. solipictus TaxID=398235 RepID=A0ABS1SHD9_9MICO|nr:hypothetical protein [Leucobacter chromiireducens subsp. solipictus]
MRSPLKPLLGAALAIGVALSASPAVAIAPPPVIPSPETTVQEPGTDPATTDPGSSDPSATDGGVTEPGAEPGTEPAEPEAPTEPASPDTGVAEPEAPSEGDDPSEVDPEAASAADASDLLDEAAVDPELLTEAPDTLSVSGTIAVVSDEVAHLGFPVSVAEGAHEEQPGEAVPGSVLVATDAGPLVSIDPALVGADVETGDRFEGALTLDATAQAAVTTEIAENGPVAVEDALTVASAADGETGPLAGVSGSAAPGTAVTAAAPATKSHGVDVVYVSGSDAGLSKLVTDAGAYWKSQTNGAVASLNPSGPKRINPAGNTKTFRCSVGSRETLWTLGARAFGKNPNSYLTSGRHLVVVVDDNCGSLSKNVAGWGTFGKIHSGGLVWVDIGARQNSPYDKSVKGATGLLAHEIGHNLGLGHGDTRVCSGTVTDSKTTNGYAASPCWDNEYGDVFNVMGQGSWAAGAKPIGLPISQKHQLGVVPAGALKTVKASGGRSQTFTLQPGGSSSGLRGLRVESPTGGNFYVEYRNRTGQDSGFYYTQSGAWINESSYRNAFENRGVRVLKGFTKPKDGVGWKESTVIPVWDTVGTTNGRFQTMRAGKKSTPWNSTARVTVVSLGSTAKVRIDFTPFIDVPYAHKFGKEINWMSSAKLSTGINAGGSLRKYAPKSNVTREAMAAFLYRLEAPKNYKAPKKSPFKDVPTNHKFYKEIAWVYTSGLSTGIKTPGGRTYAPKASVTREAMAAFIYRLEGAKYSGAKKSPFADMKPGQKFYKEITWMYSSGLSTGINKNGKRIYSPKGKVTREAMAAFIYRLKH